MLSNTRKKNKPKIKLTRRRRIIGRGTKRAPKIPFYQKNGRIKKILPQNKTKEFADLNCSPTRNYGVNNDHHTCYKSDELIRLKNSWNARYPKDAINASDPTIIWNELKKKTADNCNNEMCWLNQRFVTDISISGLAETAFAPKSPVSWRRNHNQWLDSEDIIKIMNQYEDAYPNFKFIGPTSIDFDTVLENNKCVWEKLCLFNIKKCFLGGINKIGVIFNTDTHDKGGSHWISLFMDLENAQDLYIYFFNSTGDSCPKEITKFVSRVISQYDQYKKPGASKLNFYSNDGFVHQHGNTECGMYSLYFISSLLSKKHNYSYFNTQRISDKEMENLRDKYYNNII